MIQFLTESDDARSCCGNETRGKFKDLNLYLKLVDLFISQQSKFSFRKRIKCFPSTQRRGNLETQQLLVILDSHNYMKPSFSKSFVFQNVFRPHKTRTAFANSSGLKSVQLKSSVFVPDGLVWKVDLIVEIKVCFEIC